MDPRKQQAMSRQQTILKPIFARHILKTYSIVTQKVQGLKIWHLEGFLLCGCRICELPQLPKYRILDVPVLFGVFTLL